MIFLLILGDLRRLKIHLSTVKMIFRKSENRSFSVNLMILIICLQKTIFLQKSDHFREIPLDKSILNVQKHLF